MQKNIKAISIFAAFGFVISFICGLCSKSKFYIVAIRALIFAVVFGLLGFLISFLYEKFLKDDSASDFSSGEVPSVNNSAPSKGNNVDFVVRDEELEKSDSENHFIVGDNRQMLNSSDLANPNQVTSNTNAQEKTVEQESKFVPLKNVETVENFSSKEAVSSNNVEAIINSDQNSSVSLNSGENEIDTLPDMGALGFDAQSSSSSSTEEDDSDETDESFTTSVTSRRNSSTEVPEVQDASLMAKAISSILSDEE